MASKEAYKPPKRTEVPESPPEIFTDKPRTPVLCHWLAGSLLRCDMGVNVMPELMKQRLCKYKLTECT
jgi:hypothetical protein